MFRWRSNHFLWIVHVLILPVIIVSNVLKDGSQLRFLPIFSILTFNYFVLGVFLQTEVRL